MDNSTIIREIKINDFIMLKRFFLENNLPEIRKNFNPFPLNSDSAYNIIFKKNKDKFFVSVYHDEIIGLSMLRGWDEGYSVPSFGILIDHRFQNIGLGKRMIEYTLKKAKDIKCSEIRLTVFEDNYVALKLYGTFGFVQKDTIITKGTDGIRKKIILLKCLKE